MFSIVSKDNFRKPYRDDLSLSTVGYGSYVGAPDEIDDLKVVIDDFEKENNFLYRCLMV